ncbi:MULTISPECIES: hypothetical protein [Acidiphilium]|uniref:hypothetical protein n=1 Tax=Acidiphilium TaxID=522 RepID=UPI00257DA337|nr:MULTISPECIES: hypothetical protein [Acidiphilium]
MRCGALREADALPAGDIALRRALATNGVRPTAAALHDRAAAWRPWRPYATMHLWTADAAAIVQNRESNREAPP